MKETVIADTPALTTPPPLQQGDTIGLFCPAGPVREMSRVENGIRLIEAMGFKVRLSTPLQEEPDTKKYLAAPDTKRAQALNSLWAENKVKALMAVRGGYGCLRMVDQLDFTLFARQPKWLIGFSDLTVILSAIAGTSGLVSLHGPVVSSLAANDTASRERFHALITGNYAPYSSSKTDIRVIKPGIGSGRIVVGNLTTLVHLLATPWEPVLNGAILILEDTGESMYRIDRMLTQLDCSSRLSSLAGLILGTFDTGSNSAPVDLLQEQLFQRISELTRKYAYPVWGNFPVGHQAANQAIPYGMVASMGTDDGTSVLQLHPLQAI